ncbi:hypothetical protein K0A97_00995 [Patescibacteria group bacterium]|nr:hypothetical protein [Patescibacteria group bacterium]
MEYLFILGRNIELSIAEVKSFLEKEGVSFKEISIFKNSLLLRISQNLEKGIIEKLGGVISIGEVLIDGNKNHILKNLDNLPLYLGAKNKLNYVIYDFEGEEFQDICLGLKNKFKKEGIKATEKNLTKNIKLQNGGIVPKVSSNLIDEQYFLFKNRFGKIIETTDYESIEARDMNKPARRNELSISPRLAKILINLSQVKKNETLIDPFCGIGVILQEALLQKIKVLGIDKDKSAVAHAKLNLNWFGFSKDSYQILEGDSSRLSIPRVNSLVTEPYLGEIQRKRPSFEKAKLITNHFESLIIRVLKNLKNKVEGRIVFTSPLILVGKKRFPCNIEKICSLAGLELIFDPLPEYREGQIIGRNIIVTSKKKK